MTGGWTPQQLPRSTLPEVDPVTTPLADAADVPPRVDVASADVRSRLLELGHRFDISRQGAVALVGVAVVALAFSFGIGWRARARPATVAAPVATSSGPAVPASSMVVTATPAPLVVVDVAGRVRHPGLIRLRAGSRVADALRAAGGVRPHTDLTSLNLAAPLVDGEQVLVGGPGPTAATAPDGSTSASGSSPVDLNTADVSTLDELPGIGPVLAQRIVDYRTTHGRFTAVSQLQDVSGIGPAKYADLHDLVRV
jgi:competence protein ComEA